MFTMFCGSKTNLTSSLADTALHHRQKRLKQDQLRIMGKSQHSSKHMFDQCLNWPL